MPVIAGLIWLGLLLTLGFPQSVMAVFDPLEDLNRSMRGSSTSLQARVRQQFQGRQSRGRVLGAADWKQLEKFYAERDYKPLWIHDGAPSGEIRDLLERIRSTPFTGISGNLLLPFGEYQPQWGIQERLASYDVLFTEILAAYAKVIATGRFSPAQYDPDWLIKPPAFSLASFLVDLGKRERSVTALLDRLDQRHPAYLRLVKVFGYYQTIAERGGWSTLPEGMTTLKPGDRSRWVPHLRQRLRAEFSFFSLEPENSPRYEPDLAGAVKAFQRRNGLPVDGVVGPATREALNRTVEDRLRSILSSIERWRWMPRKFDDRYLIVNIPSFDLELFVGGQSFWETRVIIGRKERPTPSIASTISQLKVNPKWHVPDKIAVKDLIPKQMRNPNFLKKAGYQVFLRDQSQEIDPAEIDWAYYQTADDFPYLLRQEAGDSNALGRLKFEMPSSRAIYLHDTPTRNLFQRDERAFSSGCVRVQEPYELAGMLLNRSEPMQGRRQILREIEAGETKSLQLPERVPVYLTYFTTWVDEQGQAHFRRDIYGRNKKFADVRVLND